MTKVVEVKIVDPEQLARPRKCGTDSISAVGKDAIAVSRLALDDCLCFRWQFAPDVIPSLDTGVFHIADQDAGRVLARRWFEALPLDPGYLFLAARREQREDDDVHHRCRARRANLDLIEMPEKPIQFVQGRAAVALVGFGDEALLAEHE